MALKVSFVYPWLYHQFERSVTLRESMGEAGCGMTESHSADWLTHTNIYIYENRSYLL